MAPLSGATFSWIFGNSATFSRYHVDLRAYGVFLKLHEATSAEEKDPLFRDYLVLWAVKFSLILPGGQT